MKPSLLAEMVAEVAATLEHHEAYFHCAFIPAGSDTACPAISGEFDNCMVVVAEIIKEAVGLFRENTEIPIDGVIDMILHFRIEKLRPTTSVVIVYWPNLPSLPGTAPTDEDTFGD